MKISPTIQTPQVFSPLLCCVLAGLLLGGCATTESVDALPSDGVGRQLATTIKGMDGRYATGSIQSRDVAETALAQVAENDAALQNWYGRAEQACYQRFFVNSCLIDIKLHKREYSMILQRIRVEANALERKLHIEELDNNLKARQAQKPQ